MPIRFAGLGGMRRSIVGAVAILAAALAAPSLGQQPQQGGDHGAIEAIKRTLDEAEAATAREGLWPQALTDLRRTVAAAREELRARIADLEPRVAEADARLRQLGPPPARDAPAEGAAVAAERERLTSALGELDGALKQTRLLAVHADQLAARLAERRQTLYARELFERSASVLNPSFWIEAAEALPEHMRNLSALARWWASAVRDRGPLPAFAAALLLLGAAFAAVAVTRWWLPRFDIRTSAETRLAKARTGLVVFLWLALRTPLALVVGLSVLHALGLWPDRFEELGAGLVAATVAAAFGRGVARGLLAPDRPERRLIAVHDVAVPCFHDYLVWSTRAVGVIILLQSVHKILLTPSAIILATHALFALAVAGLLWRLIRCVLRAKEQAGGEMVAPAPWLRLFVWLIIGLIVAALVGGYVAFAAFVALRVVVAVAVIGLLYLLLPGIDALFTEALSEGTERGRALAANLGVAPRNIGLINMLLSAAIRVLLIVAALLLMIGPREFSTVDLVDSFRRMPLAVRMGEITISLQALLGAAAVLIMVLLITRVVQRWLQAQLLPRTSLEPSLQHSIATIFGYVGIITAISLALGSLGIDLQKIAFIAGALSLGIGFGLQAVVSNFVSGLILLAERPIRVGDSIVVKGEEGWVRRIRVRATEIETYDRASVIIPNSELITGVVKNWTHANTMGRIVVKVGVGYECDPEQARDILTTLANEHPQVLRTPPPRAFLVAFSDSALDFELRCVVANVENGLAVKSDLHYAILKRFREAGIEIPYPQREIRFRQASDAPVPSGPAPGGAAASEKS
jgi:potassium-dependent mechanosensitive channel